MYKSLFINAVFIAILVLINPKLGEAASQTIKIYASEGDGYLIARNYNDDWDELHDRTTAIGEGVDTEGAFYTGKEDIYVQTSKYYKWGRQSYVAVRPLIPFDTSLIPDDAEIVSANLNLYPATWKDGDTEIHVVQTTQSDTHSIIVEDFDQVGAIDNPTEGGSFNSNVTPNQYISIPINNVGLNWVNKDGWTKLGLRTHEDAYDISPVRNNGASFYSSEELDVTKRPYLEITYTTPDVDSFPLYTQIKSPYPSLLETESWASTTYAEGKGNTGDYKCGLSIAKCGCAITSLVMSARSRGITVGADGSDINPGNINSWLEDNDGYTQTGAVVWSAAAKYFGTKTDDVYSSRYQSITFGNTDPMSEIDDALATTTEDAIAYKNGHYVFLSEKTTDSYKVKDPVWYQTVTANDEETDTNKGTVNDYDNSFEQARILKVAEVASEIKGNIEVVIASPVELRITQADGKRAGYSDENEVDLGEIALSGYDRDVYINLAGKPVAPTSTQKQLILNRASGKNQLELIGVGDGDYSLYIYVTGADGKTYVKEQSGVIAKGEVLVFEIEVDTGVIKEVKNDDDEEEDEEDDEDDDEDDDDDDDESDGENGHDDKANKNSKFFTHWLNKIENEFRKGKSHQARAHVETFHKLLKAKKVDDELWLAKLEKIVGDYEPVVKGEGKGKGNKKS